MLYPALSSGRYASVLSYFWQRTKVWTQPGCGVGGCEVAGGEQKSSYDG